MTVEDAHDLAVLRSNCLAGLVTLGEFARGARGLVKGAPVGWSAASSWSDLDIAPRWVVGAFRSLRARVAGLVPPKVRVIAALGVVRVDLADARLLGDGLEVTALALFGRVEVVVPQGIAVELKGARLAAGEGTAVALPGAPRLRVRGVPLLGFVRVSHS